MGAGARPSSGGPLQPAGTSASSAVLRRPPGGGGDPAGRDGAPWPPPPPRPLSSSSPARDCCSSSHRASFLLACCRHGVQQLGAGQCHAADPGGVRGRLYRSFAPPSGLSCDPCPRRPRRGEPLAGELDSPAAPPKHTPPHAATPFSRSLPQPQAWVLGRRGAPCGRGSPLSQ